MNIYVTGPCGSDRKTAARNLAEKNNMTYLDFDSEIEKRDGRTISRICMTMGEHEYRNKEYELLDELASKDGFCCACSDAILFDPMCLELMEQKKICIADKDKTSEELWNSAKIDKSIPYAFMINPNDIAKKNKFMELFNIRKDIYGKYEAAENCKICE